MNSSSMMISNDQEYLKVFPNPATNKIRIETTTNEDFGTALTAVLTDALGRVKTVLNFESSSMDMDITDLDEGVYLLQVIDLEGKSQHQRFVKR